MFDRELLKSRLEQTWQSLDYQQHQILREASLWGVDAYEMKLPNGQFVLIDVLTAKARVLSSIVELGE